jgi:hypothetical protein
MDVQAKPRLVMALREELRLYAKRNDPAWPISKAIAEAFGNRKAAARVRRPLVRLSTLVRDAGEYATEALSIAFAGDHEVRRRAFEQWRQALDAMANSGPALDALLVRRSSGPAKKLPLYEMCSRTARLFRRHGLRATTTDPGPLADTLRLMLEAAGRVVEDIRPYLRQAVRDSKESM